MRKLLTQSHRLLLGIAIIAVIAATAFLGTTSASAGGMGGIDVHPTRVCLNGVRLSGTDVVAAALNRNMTAKIFRGHVGVPINLVAVGNSHTYTAVGQTKGFSIYYPSNSFQVGDPVTYSVLSNDGSGYGGGQFGYVSNCHLWIWWF